MINTYNMLWSRTSLEGAVLRMTGAERGRTEGRQRAVVELRNLLARLYRSFVAWGSLYGDLDLRYEQERRREEVVELLGELPGQYLARSMWLEQATRKKIEKFIAKSEVLYSDFVADIIEQGYPRTRAAMANRVSRELGSLKKEADTALNTELAGIRQPRWRKRLR
ncbi:MAG: hypothetical protein LC781_18330 [Actinobacteria bacterium]|nr:hypothetical protein [Actinomycetota bacterium]